MFQHIWNSDGDLFSHWAHWLHIIIPTNSLNLCLLTIFLSPLAHVPRALAAEVLHVLGLSSITLHLDSLWFSVMVSVIPSLWPPSLESPPLCPSNLNTFPGGGSRKPAKTLTPPQNLFKTWIVFNSACCDLAWLRFLRQESSH